MKGAKITTHEELADTALTCRVFFEGNARIVTEHFQSLLDKPDLKIAYFGSHYLNDVLATHELEIAPAKWEALAVDQGFSFFDKNTGKCTEE